MKWIIANTSKEIITAFESEFKDEKAIELKFGDILLESTDAIVSPANSYGFMDGGLDYAICEKYGWEIEAQVRKKIIELPMGELLIGQTLVVPLNADDCKFLICAPTMRIPTNVNIDNSVNAYLAMKATLVACIENPQIDSVVIPTFCTGVGEMPAEISAKQMHVAFDEIINGRVPKFDYTGDIQRYHRMLSPNSITFK